MLKVVEQHYVEFERALTVKEIRQQVKATTGFEVRRMDSFTLIALATVYGLLKDKQLNGEIGLYGIAQYFSVDLLQKLVFTINDDQDIRPLDFIATVGNAANYYLAKLFKITGPNLFLGDSTNSDIAVKMLVKADLSSNIVRYAIIVRWHDSPDKISCSAQLLTITDKN